MRTPPPVILVVTAHPDDETFGCGGTLASYAARGCDARVLLATSGQAGEIGPPELDTPENHARLGAIREAEARAAVATLGAASVDFLGHVDGTLADLPAGRLAREVAAALRRLRPDVVVTFGPDGVYGHPDHVAVSAATTEAWDLAADPAADLPGAPHAAARLFYQVISAEAAEARNAARGPVMLNGVPHPFVGYSDEEITTFVEATPFLETKIAALACHRTQTGTRMDEIARGLREVPLRERFVLARSRVPDAPGLDGDLLAGLD